MSFGITAHHQIFAVLNEIAVLLPVFLIIFTWRGFIQALVAKIMGDDTAQRAGFLTLNPLAHVDLGGLMVILLVFFALGSLLYGTLPRAVLLIFLIMLGVRWTIPTPINDVNFKNHKIGSICTILSGPLGNFTLAFIFVPLLKLILWKGFPAYVTVTLVDIFKTLIDISLFFGVLDLIPVPPFDGGRLLRHLVPFSQQHVVDWLEQYSLIILLILFFAPGVSDIFFGSIIIFTSCIKKLMFYPFF